MGNFAPFRVGIVYEPFRNDDIFSIRNCLDLSCTKFNNLSEKVLLPIAVCSFTWTTSSDRVGHSVKRNQN
jgi:hypothetical protein